MTNSDYCAYLRKSRSDRNSDMTDEYDVLSRHREILTELARTMNISIKKFYCEIVSGDTISDRPMMRELLNDVDNGMWAGVFVVEIERLARGNTRDQGIVAESFKYANTKIITPLKIYDPTDEFDEEYFEFGLFMARREYKVINRRLQRGRLASLKEGNFISSTAPYGYDRVKNKNGKGYMLSINPKESQIVKLIFEWYCNGMILHDGSIMRPGTELIAQQLDTLGIKPRLSDHWSKSTICDMLQNPVYFGDVRFGYRSYSKQLRDNATVKNRITNLDCSQNQGKHEAIISLETFNKAQKIKKINLKSTVPAKTKLQNPLSGLVYCKKCGALMTRLGPNTKNKYATLKCPNRYCDMISSPLFLVEENIIKYLEKWLESYRLDCSSSDKSNLMDPYDSEINIRKKSLSAAEKEIDALKSQLDKTYTFLERGIYTLDIFTDRQKTLNNNIDSLASTIATLNAEIDSFNSLKFSKEEFAPKVEYILSTYESSLPDVRNLLLKETISRVVYEKNQANTRGKLRNANFILHIYPKLPG